MVKPFKPDARNPPHTTEWRRVLLSDGHYCFTPRVQPLRRARYWRPHTVFILLGLIILLQALL
ncbi:hypothetical protein [Paludibacterium sp.]|uniref:hypothetical protein n=1 Tax=Paludibacterium sp. TaxID=1917523 RepID=UPI0025F50E1D|nr:hypothetical protein [Paludibacterium sp.]MBV8647958.1 hypothetical protein [Paludibacterium sp.]